MSKLSGRHWAFWLLFLSLVSHGLAAAAFGTDRPACEAVFNEWLRLEVEANRVTARERNEFVAVATVKVPRSEIEIHLDPATANATRANLSGILWNEESVSWPIHPYAESKHVPFVHEKPTGNLPLHFTASRSMVLKARNGSLYSLKLPTDRPHLSERQPHKARIGAELETAVENSTLLERQLSARQAKSFDILPDVGFLRDRKTGSGILIRDLNRLISAKDKIYVPAFSLRWISNDPNFLFAAYLRPLARVLRELQEHYGWVHISPHAQNFLVEFDLEMKPTGRLLIRDLSELRRVPEAGIPAELEAQLIREALDFLQPEGGPTIIAPEVRLKFEAELAVAFQSPQAIDK